MGKLKGNYKLPSFRKMRRSPKGPRDKPFLQDQDVEEERFTRSEMAREHRQHQRIDDDRWDSAPLPLHQRGDFEDSGLDFGSSSNGFDQDFSERPGQLRSEMLAARRPLTNYDIHNPGRPPRASTAFEASRVPVQSSTRSRGRRHSMDLSSYQVGLNTVGEQRTEFAETKKEVRKLRSEREQFRQLYENESRAYVHMKNLRDDAVNSRNALERQLEALAKENKVLKTGANDYHNANQWLNDELIGKKKLLESKESELQTSKHKMKKLETQLAKQKSIQKDALEEQRRRMHDEKEEVDRQLREVKKALSCEKDKVHDLKSDKTVLQRTMRELEQKLKDAGRALLEEQVAAKQQQDTIRELEKQKSTTNVVATQEIQSNVRKAQETAFNMMLEPARWMPKADTEVRRSFDKIRDDLWSWTKTCVRKDMCSEEFRTDAAIQVLRNVSQLNDGAFYFPFDDPRYSTKLPALICMATLSSLLYDDIFRSPFFWQQPETNAHHDDMDGETLISMDEIYIEALKDDEKTANEWRCQMLRTFDPQITNIEKSTDIQSKAERCRAAAAQRFIEQFLSSDIKLFLDPEVLSNNHRIKTLFEIISRATRLSYRLWTQKNRLHVMSLSELNLAGDDGVSRFKFGSELVQHQAFHNVELSKCSTSLDGRPVAIVTHPAIVAYGDSNGEQYGSYKVWKKAEVWMG